MSWLFQHEHQRIRLARELVLPDDLDARVGVVDVVEPVDVDR